MNFAEKMKAKKKAQEENGAAFYLASDTFKKRMEDNEKRNRAYFDRMYIKDWDGLPTDRFGTLTK